MSELDPAPLPGPVPSSIVRAVLKLRSRLRALLDLAGPPEIALLDRTAGAAQTALVGTVARLGVPDLLAERGAMSAHDVAAAIGTDADATHRELRALALTGVFARTPDGRFENNRLSDALRRGRPTRAREFAMYFASASNLRAWGDLEGTLRTGKNAFERVNGKNVWDWFDEHVEERETFAQAMMGMTTVEAPAIATLYPFAEVQKVCDVGGGRGTLLSEILIRHPHLRGVLCDAPGVLESARELLRARGVASRVELSPGSFFDEVPRGAQAYVLKNILHDWDDERCVRILRVCRAAMEPGARVLVCDAIVEVDTDEALAALADLQMMMVCCEGRERGRADFGRLFRESGFELGRVYEGATIAVIEGRAI
jgi:hypothetical protein